MRLGVVGRGDVEHLLEGGVEVLIRNGSIEVCPKERCMGFVVDHAEHLEHRQVVGHDDGFLPFLVVAEIYGFPLTVLVQVGSPDGLTLTPLNGDGDAGHAT